MIGGVGGDKRTKKKKKEVRNWIGRRAGVFRASERRGCVKIFDVEIASSRENSGSGSFHASKEVEK